MKSEFLELIICDCSSTEHQLIFQGDFEEPRMCYVEIHLCKLPFWKRLWHGIKYICGYRCKYGEFEEVILTSEHVEELERVVEFLKNEKVEKYDNNGRIQMD